MWKVCIDLFAGSGGFSHGWIQAGGRVAVAVDVWEEALQNHALNHPQVPVLNLELGGDIEETARILREYLEPFGVNVHFHLHGSPPCQALSNASSRVNPEDGMFMVNWFLDLVAYMKPDSWSMENVVPVARRLPPGTPWVKLCSADFGVPQKRYRIFAGEGWEAKATHKPEEWVSVAKALPSIPDDVRIISRRRKAGEEPQHYNPNGPAHTITQVNHIIEAFVNTAGSGPSSSRRAISQDSPIDEPAKTVVSKGLNLRVKENGEYRSIRSLTVEEAVIIQGWPGMKFIDGLTKANKRLMVGNMVSPPVAKGICEGIQ
jgi:site-specific DNA-cytosine methylase